MNFLSLIGMILIAIGLFYMLGNVLMFKVTIPALGAVIMALGAIVSNAGDEMARQAAMMAELEPVKKPPPAEKPPPFMT